MKFSEYRIRQFVKLIRTTADTTILIQRIAENRFFLQCCAAVVKPEDRKAPLLNELSRVLEKTAERQLFSFKDFQDKLAPVAIALGLNRPDAGSIQTDYYRILNIHHEATDREIKTAYRQKARAYHPDTGTGEKNCFVRVQEAYEVLSSKSLRRQYDLSRNTADKWRWQEHPDFKTPGQTGRTTWRRLAMPFVGIVLLLAAIAFIVDAINQDLALTRDISAYTPKKEGPSTAPGRPDISPEEKPASQDTASSGSNETSDFKRSQVFIGPDTRERFKTDGRASDIAKDDVFPTMSSDETDGDDQSFPPNVHDQMEIPIKKTNDIPTGDAGLKEASLPDNSRSIDKIPIIQAKISKNKNIANPPPYRESVPVIKAEAVTDGCPGNMGGRLVQFLHAYCRTYENRDLDRFAFFFTDYAEENGVLFKTLLPAYKKNFQSLEKITYQIDMNNYLWDLDGNTVRIEGDFMLSWRKKQETDFHDYNGTIRMDLILFKDTFLVENLSYRFAK